LVALLNRMPEESIRQVLRCQEVDGLLDLEPPLETVLSFPHEGLDAERTALQLQIVRRDRECNPRLALLNLAEVLKRIRNRRARGFKTPSGPRDSEILGSALVIVRVIGTLAFDALRAQRHVSVNDGT
jgi:hypothetical protein